MNWSLIHEPGANGRSLARRSKNGSKNKLQQIVQNPRIESARLSDLPDCYKIKLKASGYRLVYQVEDHILVVTVIAVGKRDRNWVYETALARLKP